MPAKRKRAKTINSGSTVAEGKSDGDGAVLSTATDTKHAATGPAPNVVDADDLAKLLGISEARLTGLFAKPWGPSDEWKIPNDNVPKFNLGSGTRGTYIVISDGIVGGGGAMVQVRNLFAVPYLAQIWNSWIASIDFKDGVSLQTRGSDSTLRVTGTGGEGYGHWNVSPIHSDGSPMLMLEAFVPAAASAGMSD